MADRTSTPWASYDPLEDYHEKTEPEYRSLKGAVDFSFSAGKSAQAAANEAKIEELVGALQYARDELNRVAIDEDPFTECLAEIDAALRTAAGEK